MTITVDSGQWTGKSDDSKAAPVLWGEFQDEAARDAAIARLQNRDAVTEDPTEDTRQTVDEPDENAEEADLRNRRQLGVGVAMAAGALAASGLVIASGGALLPAITAAAVAGTGAGAAGEAVASAVTEPESEKPARQPPSDAPLIGLHYRDEAAREAAEKALRSVGAIRLIVDAD